MSELPISSQSDTSCVCVVVAAEDNREGLEEGVQLSHTFKQKPAANRSTNKLNTITPNGGFIGFNFFLKS